MTRCARCDWQSDPDQGPDREQLRAHALNTQHPLCSVCGDSLATTDPEIACETCLTAAREHLSGILTMWQELPRYLGHATGQAYDRQRGGGDEHSLPGGTILALLAPGSAGGASRFEGDWEPAEPVRWWVLGQQGPLTAAQYRTLELAAQGREHLVDNLQTDPSSVQQELTTWAQEWSESGAPALPAGRLTVPAAGRYHDVHARWAARQHDAFSEFADDMTKLHGRLEHATARRLDPTRASASCFDCKGDLVRRVGEHQVVQWWLPGAVGPLPRLLVWRGQVEETVIGLDGQEHPVWTCARCSEQYDQERYNLALEQALSEASRQFFDGDEYATPASAATQLRRSERTVRDWARRELVRQRTVRGVLYVHLEDAAEQHATRATRKRSA